MPTILPPRGKVFLSYRRNDSKSQTGRIYDHLIRWMRKKDVFYDVDSIEGGSDFEARINTALSLCVAEVVMIGPNWAGATDHDGNRLLNRSSDYPRQEVELALKMGKIIVPVLLDGAQMPGPTELPDSLVSLSRINALEIRSGHDFEGDLERLKVTLANLSPLGTHSWWWVKWNTVWRCARLNPVKVMIGAWLLLVIAGGLGIEMMETPGLKRAATSDGQQIVSIHSRKRYAYLWSIPEGQMQRRFACEAGGVLQAVAINRQGKEVAIASNSHLKLSSTSDEKRWEVPAYNIKDIVFSPEGGHLIVSFWPSDHLSVIDTNSGREVAHIVPGEPGGESFSWQVYPQGDQILACSVGMVSVWKYPSNSDLPVFTFRDLSSHPKYVDAVILTADGRRIVTARTKEFKMWDAKTGEFYMRGTVPKIITGLAQTDSSDICAVLTHLDAWIFDPAKSAVPWQLDRDIHDGFGEFIAAALLSKSQRIACLCKSGALQVFDTKSGKLVMLEADPFGKRLPVSGYEVDMSLSIVPGASYVLVRSLAGAAIWDLATGRRVGTPISLTGWQSAPIWELVMELFDDI